MEGDIYMYEELEGLEEKFKVTDFPLNLGIEPTNHCNLHCVMCNNGRLTRPRGFMSMKLYKKIIDEVASESPGTRVWLDFCGEAMAVGWKLYYMIDYAKKQGLRNVCINTNGTLMKPEFADMLLDAGTDYISLDCDGYSKEVYESVRAGGDRDTFYANAGYLLQERARRGVGCTIDIKVIEMEQNKEEVGKIVQYWQERGAWTAIRRRSAWGGESPDRGDVDALQEGRIACGHLLGTCAVTWDGNVAGCAWDSDCKVSCGNVQEKSIRQIWQERNQGIVSVHMGHRWDDLWDICKGCQNWRNIGEMRYDENGNEVQRNYGRDERIF